MTSFSQADITNFDNAESQTKMPSKWGQKIGRARCEFTATGGSTIGAHTLGLTIPAKSYVTKAYYKVLTTFTSATDAATIALKVASANDVVSAIAISDVSNPWDVGGLVPTIPTGALSDEISVTVDSLVTATVAVEALTAGKLVLWVEFAYYGDLTTT